MTITLQVNVLSIIGTHYVTSNSDRVLDHVITHELSKHLLKSIKAQ